MTDVLPDRLAQQIVDLVSLPNTDATWQDHANAVLTDLPTAISDAQSRIKLVDTLEARSKATNAFTFNQLKESISQVVADERKELKRAMLLPKARKRQAAVVQNAIAATLIAVLAGCFFLDLIDLITTVLVAFLLAAGYQWAQTTEDLAETNLQDIEDKITDLDEFEKLLSNR